jgi:Oxidoreductase molybdopterin binding domain
MSTRRFWVRRFLFLGCVAAGLLTAQDVQPLLQVTGDVKETLSLSPEDLAKMPRASVKAASGGLDTAYEGVWLHEVLKRAGVPQGSQLRGKALAGYVLAQTQDGYQVVFSLGELDPGFLDSEILVADTANGKPLSGTEGRFRLVALKDKAGARSVRMLNKLEVVQLRK